MHNQLSEMKEFSGQKESGVSLVRSSTSIKTDRRRGRRIGRG